MGLWDCTVCVYGNIKQTHSVCCIILHAIMSSDDDFLFQNILSVITSECQTVLIQIRPDKYRA